MVRDVKITVLKRLAPEDIYNEYAAPGLPPLCNVHKEGDVFIAVGGDVAPEGLCSSAWRDMEKFAFALAHGAGGFWEGWVGPRNTAIVSCDDGLRPVIFKLEAIDK